MMRLAGFLSLIVMILSGGCASRLSPAAGMAAPAMRTLSEGGTAQTRVVIRSGSLTVKARELDVVLVEVEDFVDEIDGWVESFYLTEDRRLDMTLRVPEPELENAMTHLSTLGRVLSRSIRSQDVTDQVIDLEARLKNLKALRDRLRSYLTQTKDLKEIIEVERELARVQTEIESIEAKLNALRNDVRMSQLDFEARRR